jgi:hypothetical protein
MSKPIDFTMELEPELRAEFLAEAEAVHRSASQVLRELMRQFIQHQRETREYDEFLQSKIETARGSINAGIGVTNDKVEGDFAARRAQTAGKM